MKRSYWLHLAMTLISVLMAIYVLSTPYNRHEWMLGAPWAIQQGLTYCGLPPDDGEPMQESFIFVLPVLLIAFGFCVATRRVHPTVCYAAALVALWACRFILFAPRCPGTGSF